MVHFSFFENISFLQQKHFYSHFSLIRCASYREWMKAFNLILINTDAPHFRRSWSWTLAARMAFSRRSKKKADNGSVGGETRWRPRLLSSSVVKIFFCFKICLMLEKMGRMSWDDHLVIAKGCRLSRQKAMWRKNGFNVNAGITQISPIYHLLVKDKAWRKYIAKLLSVERQGGENDISFTHCLCETISGKKYF